jgi:hypothetical protein
MPPHHCFRLYWSYFFPFSRIIVKAPLAKLILTLTCGWLLLPLATAFDYTGGFFPNNSQGTPSQIDIDTDTDLRLAVTSPNHKARVALIFLGLFQLLADLSCNSLLEVFCSSIPSPLRAWIICLTSYTPLVLYLEQSTPPTNNELIKRM